MAKKELPPISGDTQDFLEGQVKKGKARKFFLVYKGADIRTLVVFKKGPFNSKLMEAKKQGFLGDTLCGIVTGSGQQLRFLLAGNQIVANEMNVDTCTEECPIATPKFRKFLVGNGLKFKPEFEIVTDLANMPGAIDDDEEETASQAPPPAPTAAEPAAEPPAELETPPAPQASPAPVEAAPTSSQQQTDDVAESASRAEELQRQFDSLQPRLAAAVTAHSDEAEDLNDLADEFGQSMNINDLDVAEEWLGKLTEALDELPEPAEAPAPEGGMAAFETRFKQVAPKAVPVAKAGGELGSSVATLLKQAQTQRAAGDHAAGMTTLDEIERLMQAPPAAPAPPPQPAEDLGAKFRTRFAALLPQIKQAAGTPQGNEAKRLAGEAGAAAKQQNFSQANFSLDEAEKALRAAGPAPAQSSADVLAIWRDAKDDVDGQLNSVQRVLANSQHPFLRDVAKLGLNGLTEDPSRVFVGMMASLFDYQGAAAEQRQTAGQKVLDSISKYREFLAGNRVLEVLDSDPLCGPTTIRATLTRAMDEMEQNLAALAS